MAKKRVKVKMLTSMAAPNWSLSVGDVTEVDPKVADAWVKAKLARLVDEIETAAVEPPEKAVRRRKKGE